MNHHNHHQCHCRPTPTTTCHCTICYTTATHYPPPDPLIHSISSHQLYHHPPQIHQFPPPQNHPQTPQNHHPQTPQNHHLFPNHRHHENVQENPPPPNPTISSLIHRISALETSLRRRKHSSSRSSSLRDAAARTIQTHFRAFLVRRSVTLRHLKDLACIKSALNHLKSSVSNKPQFDSRIVSRESRKLLIKLDSIQGGDPMIRDGKRAISRELIRFMEVIDEMCVESQVITVKNVRFGKNSKKSGSGVLGYDERKLLERLKNHRKNVDEVDESFDVEIPRKDGVPRIRIGDLSHLTKSQSKSQPKVKKNVRFDEDGNVYRLIKSKHNQVSSDGSDGSNGDEEEVEEIGVFSKEAEVEEDDSSEISENEMDPRKNLRTRIHHTTKKNQPDEEVDVDDEDEEDGEDDTFVFSAPLPAKMEY
ncbi:hypothetical protein SSX86_031988 [Deinandra increscens subsp. villosa]|uniref:BAG family molecular chaperone regulator 8, chloroplastic n=1 Tax=Deinandra increscens subsp. villosa TaxID=3103831 RepID=A0AAP0C4A5_9ASTR